MFSNIYEMMLDIGLNSRVVLEQLMEHMWLFISFKKQVPFMNRKGFMSMNIFVIYDFNMCLTFVLLGWEGIDAWHIYLDGDLLQYFFEVFSTT